MPTLHPALPLLAAALLLGGCFERARASVEDTTRPVLAARATPASETAARDYAGTVKPKREADLGFRAGGRIVARAVDLGARVSKGDLLARLDPTDLGLALRAAEADLAGAEAQAAQSEADARRSHTLVTQGWTPAAIDEQKQAAGRIAAERVRAARAALSLAQNKLSYAELRAPADGIVTAVLADPGTVVAEGQAVLRQADAAALEVEVPLPETALAGAAGLAASVSLWARPEQRLDAHLREVAGAATPGLRTFTARFALDAPPPWLAIGMSATVRLTPTAEAGLTGLPLAAIGDRGDGPMVWVIDPAAGRIAARRVQVASLSQTRALVSGVHVGELVVGAGVQTLDPAARVRVSDIMGE